MARFLACWLTACTLALAAFGALAAPVLFGGLGGGGQGGGSTNDGALVVVGQADGKIQIVGHPAGVGRLSGLAFGIDGTLYGATQGSAGGPPPPGDPGFLIRIDPATGALLSSTRFNNGVADIPMADLAVQPGTGVLFGIGRPGIAIFVPGRLYTINTTTGIATAVGDTGAFAASITFAPDGTMYLSGRNQGDTVHTFKKINPANAAALTSVITANFFGAIAVRPTDGVIFGSLGNTGEIHTIDPATGASTLVGKTGTDYPGGLTFGTGGPAPSNNYQGLWWASPAASESGWGINFAHQNDTIFASWFTYDATGRGLWRVMTAPKTGANTYSGTLYETHGPAFNAVPFDPKAVVATAVGTGTLTFTDANNGSFNYVIGAVNQTKAITRQVFGPLPTCAWSAGADLAGATNYQDLWWAKPGGVESGWGINLNHEGDTIFATWFTYDLDGTPLWLVATTPKASPGVYTGDLYRTTGPAYNVLPFDPSKVVPTKVGTATFTFADGNNAKFDYSVMYAPLPGPVVQSKTITREIFSTGGTTCH